MRIWVQGTMNYAVNASWSEFAETQRDQLTQSARPDTEVAFHGTEVGSTLIEKYHYYELVVKPNIVRNAIRAEQEGYDAFCVACMLDPGYSEVKEVVDIPVCFLAESSMHLASILAPNFALLSHNKSLLLRVTELAKRYGLQSKLVPSNSLELGLAELQEGWKNPELILQAIKKVTIDAAERGACMLVASCNYLNVFLAKYRVVEIEGIPVLSGARALIKMAELMVDLKNMGITRSRLGLYPRMAKEELGDIRKLLAVEQKM